MYMILLLTQNHNSINDVLRIVWASKLSSQAEDLSKFLIIQKYYIIDALHWLIANIFLYKDIKINYCFLNTWNDKFIPCNITNNIVNCNFNYCKCLSYTANICKNNYENNFYTIIADIRIEKDYIYNNCVYSDINNKKQNPTLQLLLAICNIKATDLFSDSISLFVIFYYGKSWFILLND